MSDLINEFNKLHNQSEQEDRVSRILTEVKRGKFVKAGMVRRGLTY